MVGIRGNNLPRVKKQNMQSIKEVIYKFGPIPRSEIAKLLSLTLPTITKNVNTLIEEGLVKECDIEISSENIKALGRKPKSVDFISDARFVVGVELGPYHTTMCVVDLRGKVVRDMKLPVACKDYKEMMGNLAQNIKDLIAESKIAHEKILGVGVGLPGFVEKNRGILRSSSRTDWNNRYFASDLSKLIGLPVRIENNARVRAIGEEMFSEQKRPDTFAYYLISHGIACPLMIKRNMFTGETAGAGEVGHVVVQVNGPKCDTCGNHGCLEAVASEQAIRKRCKLALKAGADTILREICKDFDNPSMREILKAEEYGDKIVSEIMQDAIVYLGIGLANVINFISPRLVIVDGYIMSLEQNRKMFLEVVRKNLFGLNDKEVDIEFIEYDEFSGAKGAAALAVKEFLIEH